MLYNLPKILLKESEQGMMIVRHILALIKKCSANTLHTYLTDCRPYLIAKPRTRNAEFFSAGNSPYEVESVEALYREN